MRRVSREPNEAAPTARPSDNEAALTAYYDELTLYDLMGKPDVIRFKLGGA
jgi:hypothetical protein